MRRTTYFGIGIFFLVVALVVGGPIIYLNYVNTHMDHESYPVKLVPEDSFLVSLTGWSRGQLIFYLYSVFAFVAGMVGLWSFVLGLSKPKENFFTRQRRLANNKDLGITAADGDAARARLEKDKARFKANVNMKAAERQNQMERSVADEIARARKRKPPTHNPATPTRIPPSQRAPPGSQYGPS
jgi:hypothetical protein